MHSILRIKEKFKFFANYNKKKISQLRCEKRFATKARRHKVEKMLFIFP
jgi:hypothetical protein